MDSIRSRPSVLCALALLGCFTAAAAGVWAQGPVSASTSGLAFVVLLLERAQMPSWVRQLWYGAILLFCVALTTYHVQHALASGAA